MIARDSTARAYDVIAPAYDLLTAGYAYGRWIAAIDGLAHDHGVRGRRALDVACGTGNALAALLALGYEATGCDLSPGMLAVARRKVGDRAELVEADMCALPVLGAFDLVTCLDDAVNHLPSRALVVAALRAMGANLAPGGLLAFDVNTLAAYRHAGDRIVDGEDRMVLWHGRPARLTAPGGGAVVAMDVLSRRSDGLWRRSRARWRHWHHPPEVVRGAVAAAGLELVHAYGQSAGARLEPVPDEERHTKALLLCRRPTHDAKGADMPWEP